MEPTVILVNEEDKEIGIATKLSAHQNEGMLHRSVSSWIFNRYNQLLIQKRAATKYHSPSLWSNTCCGHPSPGEEPLKAAHRRLREEMGFDCSLEEEFCVLFKGDVGNELTEWEYGHVFVGFYNSSPNVNLNEVEDWKWENTNWLKSDLEAHPNNYAAWFGPVLRLVLLNTFEGRSRLRPVKYYVYL
jgi:isopentenyl-diphosphate delta-isomerase